ncbi:MAG: SPX domain protein involved in polyphosphate accumulation [Halieaceae bacterium]|jgi:SPX domain protein involved in polyphosphate accumulation
MSASNNSKTTPWRCELKIPLQYRQYVNFDRWLVDNGIRRDKPYADRVVHSVYLDSADFDDYLDNVSGISARGKIRLRWYNDAVDGLVVELKNKRGKLSQKELIQLQNCTGRAPLDSSDVRLALRSHPRSAQLARQLALFPTLHARYSRSYYEISSGIRMTVDSDICYQRLYPMASRHLAHSAVDRVIEIKYSQSRQADVASILQGMPARIFRHSKYVIGVDSVCDL